MGPAFVWPTVNIPVPFGGTPFFATQLAEGRILKSMPFSFYYLPFLVTKLKNYRPVEYYEKLIEIHVEATNDLRKLRGVLAQMKKDSGLVAYHEGRGDLLAAFYRQIYKQKLGRYAELISEDEMRPVLD